MKTIGQYGIKSANSIMKAESEKAHFKTVALYEAKDEMDKIKGANEKIPKNYRLFK